MSYLQQGHIEESYYERSSKSYLDKDTKSFLDTDNNSFLQRSNGSFLASSGDSFLNGNLTDRSYLNASSSSFLTIDTSPISRIESTNKSFISSSSTSYLSMVEPSDKTNYLQIDGTKHVTEHHENHLDEDKAHHLEESGGETSDEDDEDFSHAIDWGLVVPPFIHSISEGGATKYKCRLSKRVYNVRPPIPERFDVFDFDKIKLIETIGRYHTKKNKEDVGGIAKYKQLMEKQKDLHLTELQSIALENLRIWKHKKEQELLGQVQIQNADYSDRTERMGVGDYTKEGAAERKQRREILKKTRNGKEETN